MSRLSGRSSPEPLSLQRCKIPLPLLTSSIVSATIRLYAGEIVLALLVDISDPSRTTFSPIFRVKVRFFTKTGTSESIHVVFFLPELLDFFLGAGDSSLETSHLTFSWRVFILIHSRSPLRALVHALAYFPPPLCSAVFLRNADLGRSLLDADVSSPPDSFFFQDQLRSPASPPSSYRI